MLALRFGYWQTKAFWKHSSTCLVSITESTGPATQEGAGRIGRYTQWINSLNFSYRKESQAGAGTFQAIILRINSNLAHIFFFKGNRQNPNLFFPNSCIKKWRVDSRPSNERDRGWWSSLVFAGAFLFLSPNPPLGFIAMVSLFFNTPSPSVSGEGLRGISFQTSSTRSRFQTFS